MRIFVISLKKSINRRQAMTRQMEHMGLTFEFIEAVDGNCLSQQQKERIKNKNLSSGEMACALSHAKVYEKMVQETIDQAVILEDDAIITHDFKTLIQGGYLNFDFVMLYHSHAFSTWGRGGGKLFADYTMIKPVFSPYGAVAYYLSCASAEKLYNATRYIHSVADFPLDLQELGVRCIVPRIVCHPSLDNSIIEQNRQKTVGHFFRMILPRHSRLYLVLANMYHIRKRPLQSVKGIMGNIFFKRLSPKVEGK